MRAMLPTETARTAMLIQVTLSMDTHLTQGGLQLL
jgi:hypothetical protein